MAAKVRRGNVILTVEDSEVSYYIGIGYSLIGKNGVVLQEGTPQNESDFRRAYASQLKQIESLKEIIEQYKATINDLETKLAKKAKKE